MKLIYILFIFIATLLAAACNDSSNGIDANIALNGKFEGNINSDVEKINPETCIRWVQNPENGLRKEKIIDDLVFHAQYKPHEYIVCLEERKSEIADSVLAKKVNELSDMQYFDLKIVLKNEQGELLKHNLNSQDQYDKRVNYFSFNMQQDIQLVEGNDTIPCSLFHFERAYDVTPFSTFLLGFEKSSSSNQHDKTLIVYDKTFNKGLIKFTFKKEELQKLPKIKTI